MSGFYLTLNTIQTGFHAAEESVRLFDSILGSTESSRALSSIITLVRTEFSRDDPRFRPTSLLSEQEEGVEQQQRHSGTLGSLAALTKAMTAFACLQMATHRRTLRELKQRVVYDCTVVIDSQSEETSDASPAADDDFGRTPTRSPPKACFTSPFLEPTPDFAGKYAAPPLPPRHRIPSSAHLAGEIEDLASVALDDLRITQSHRRTSSVTSMTALTSDYEDRIFTGIRSEFESQVASSRTQTSRDSTAASSPTWSRRTSVAFDLAGLGFTALQDKDRRERRTEENATFPAVNETSEPGSAPHVVSELARLDHAPSATQSDDHRSVGVEDLRSGERMTADRRGEAVMDLARSRSAQEKLPPEVQTLLALLEQQPAPLASANYESSHRDADVTATVPFERSGTHVVRTRSGRFSYEVRVEESVSTTTTTVSAFDGADTSRVVSRTARSRSALPRDHVLYETRQYHADPSPEESLLSSVDGAQPFPVNTDPDWVEIPARKRRAPSSDSSGTISITSQHTPRADRDSRPSSGLRRGQQRLQVSWPAQT